MTMMCNLIFAPRVCGCLLRVEMLPLHETYIRKFRADVKQQLEANQIKRSTDNLTSTERIALRRLQQRTDVVIKLTDKGSAVVILSKEHYINEAE